MDINEVNEELLRSNWNRNSYLKRIDFLSQLNSAWIDSDELQNFKSYSDFVLLTYSQNKILDKRIDELEFLEICKSIIKENLENIQRDVELKVNAYIGLNSSLNSEALDHLLDESNIRKREVENNLACVDEEIQDKLLCISKEIALCNFLKEKGLELEHQQKSKIEILKERFIDNKEKKNLKKHEGKVDILKNELAELMSQHKAILAEKKEQLKLFISNSNDGKKMQIASSNREVFKGINELLSDYQTKLDRIEMLIVDKELEIAQQESIFQNYKQGLIDFNKNELKKNVTIAKYDLKRFMDPINQDNKTEKRVDLSKPNVFKNNQNKGKGRRM